MNNTISSTSDCSDTVFSPILNKVAVKIWEISVNNSSGIVFNLVLEINNFPVGKN
jgi:hypothetical protein